MGVDVGADVAGLLGVVVGIGVDPVSPHPKSPTSVDVCVGVGVGVGVAEGAGDVDGVTGGTDPGIEDPELGTLDGVGRGLDPGVEDPKLGTLDGVGRELIAGEELPGVVVVPFPVTSCVASAQNAINKLTYEVYGIHNAIQESGSEWVWDSRCRPDRRPEQTSHLG